MPTTTEPCWFSASASWARYPSHNISRRPRLAVETNIRNSGCFISIFQNLCTVISELAQSKANYPWNEREPLITFDASILVSSFEVPAITRAFLPLPKAFSNSLIMPVRYGQFLHCLPLSSNCAVRSFAQGPPISMRSLKIEWVKL